MPAKCVRFQTVSAWLRLQETSPPNSNSLLNHAEAEMVLSIYRELVHRFPQLKTKPSVAIISPYKGQVRAMVVCSRERPCARAMTGGAGPQAS